MVTKLFSGTSFKFMILSYQITHFWYCISYVYTPAANKNALKRKLLSVTRVNFCFCQPFLHASRKTEIFQVVKQKASNLRTVYVIDLVMVLVRIPHDLKFNVSSSGMPLLLHKTDYLKAKRRLSIH